MFAFKNIGSFLYKECLPRIMALWALIFFIITILPAFIFYLPCFVLSQVPAAKWHRNVSRVWMTCFLYAIGCPLKKVNKHNYNMQSNYIVVANHNSFMDVVVMTPFMPRANKTIAKIELSRIPIFRWIYGWGSILVDRKNKESRLKSFHEMKEILNAGLDMVIYPEGTRNKTQQPLQPFYNGAFVLAEETKKPILPVLIFYTKLILPANKLFYLMPHTIELHFLKPILPQNHTANELKEIVFQTMLNYYNHHYRNKKP